MYLDINIYVLYFNFKVGPPGIGKTSSVLCLARQMLGVSYKDGVLELNASDERGIETVRETIKGIILVIL